MNITITIVSRRDCSRSPLRRRQLCNRFTRTSNISDAGVNVLWVSADTGGSKLVRRPKVERWSIYFRDSTLAFRRITFRLANEVRLAPTALQFVSLAAGGLHQPALSPHG